MSLLISAHRSLRRRIALGAPRIPNSALPTCDSEGGDVPGWVLVTLMTAGLVTLLWQTAAPPAAADVHHGYEQGFGRLMAAR